MSRASVSGPLADRLARRLRARPRQRDGFTINDVTGNDLDYRDGVLGQGAAPAGRRAGNWEARADLHRRARPRRRLRAERSRRAARATRFTSARDFEGHTNRDVHATTFLTRRDGRTFTFTTTTGFVQLEDDDATDLDYTPLPLITPRQRREELAVHAGSAVRVGAGRRRERRRRGAPAVAGRRLPLHAELRAGRRQQLRTVRALAVHSVRRRAALRSRRSTTPASAFTAGHGHRSADGST